MACWSREFTAEFIDLYRSLDSVWNIKSKEYKDRAKKAKGYEQLVAKVRTIDRNATRHTVVKKINCLRSAFRKEVKKVSKSKQAAEGGDGEVYVPRLWYYNRLAFLEDSNFDNDEDEDIEDKYTSEADIECEAVINVKRSPSPPPPPADESSASSTPPEKRRKLVAEDRFDIFGRIVASKLKSLPNEQRIYAEKLINDVLFEAELNTLGRGCYIAVPRIPSGNNREAYAGDTM